MSDSKASVASSAAPAASGSSSAAGPSTAAAASTADAAKQSTKQPAANEGGNDKKSAKELKAARRAAKVAERGPGDASAPQRGPPAAAAAAQRGGAADRSQQSSRDGPSGGKRPGSSSANTAGGSARIGGVNAAQGGFAGVATSAAAGASMTATASGSGRKGVHDNELTTKAVPPHPSVALFGNVSSGKPHNAHIAALVSASFRSNIHPSILRLSSQLAQYKLMVPTRVLSLYCVLWPTSSATTRLREARCSNRDLLKTVSAQVGHLVDARALGTSQGVAVRYLKYEISVVSADLTEDEAKEHLLERIDHFVRDRIVYASKIIRTQAGNKIKDGDVVMTFARSSLSRVRFSLLGNAACVSRSSSLTHDRCSKVKRFYPFCWLLASVYVRSDLEPLLAHATRRHPPTRHLRAPRQRRPLLPRRHSHLRHDGQREGHPRHRLLRNLQILRTRPTRSFVQNEAGNPRDLLLPSSEEGEEVEERKEKGGMINVKESEASMNLAVVNLLYDVTPPRFISAVASEVGLSGPESVGVILRDYKSVLYGV